MQATVHRPDGTLICVRNLGWALRHKAPLCRIAVYPRTADQHGAVLRLAFTDATYCCPFASRAVLWDWLRARRKWHGVPLDWFDTCLPLSAHMSRGLRPQED